jgi:hypothetical protein
MSIKVLNSQIESSCAIWSGHVISKDLYFINTLIILIVCRDIEISRCSIKYNKTRQGSSIAQRCCECGARKAIQWAEETKCQCLSSHIICLVWDSGKSECVSCTVAFDN